jgi:murein DD-endopeptidase MepM/ murein hydrolase activator NlpD
MSHRRPPGPTAARPGSRRPIAGRPMRTALVSALIGAALLGSTTPAYAVPPPPPNPSDSELGSAAAQQQAAAAEVGRMQGLVAAADAELQRVGDLAEAAGTAYMAAEEALQIAQIAAERTAAELRLAAEAVAASEARIALFSRDSYINGGSLSSSAALLDAEGPGELIQRAAMLDYVAENQLDVLGALEVAKVAQANADSAARAARDEMATAEEAAEAAKAEADAQLNAQQGAYERVAAEKAAYDEQLQAAQIHLLELQGARNAHDQWVAQKRAEEEAAAAAAARAAAEAAAAAERARANSSSGGGGGGGGGGGSMSGDYVAPTSGRVTSCYGARWGVTHYGVDIAAPIGTPIYAAHSGVVQRAGAATGFGQAVYIRGDDGAVTVYGHVNRYFVSLGERVSAGEEIAEVGNRGQSTGPHLHFEVHPGGLMYGGQVNPVPWLNARGVYLGGCGG